MSLLQVEPAVSIAGEIVLSAEEGPQPLPVVADAFAVVACLLPGSLLRIAGIEPGQRQPALLAVLLRMGARLSWTGREPVDGRVHPVLEVQAGDLIRTDLTREEALTIPASLPLFAVVCSHTRGQSVVRFDPDVWPERRAETFLHMLRGSGISADLLDDAVRVRGSGARPHGGRVDPDGDPELALAAAVAGLVSRKGVVLEDDTPLREHYAGVWEGLSALVRR